MCLSLLTVVISAILLAIVYHSKVAAKADPQTLEMMGRLEADLQSLHNSLPLMVENSVNKEMVGISKTLNAESEKRASSMASFQNGVNETLSNNASLTNKALLDSIVAINKKVDDNFKALNDKVNLSLSDGFKGANETMTSIQTRLAKIDEAQKNLDGLERQVVTLNSVLTSNQKRGQYGELQLSMILEATFPDGKGTLYDEQYVIKKGNGDNDIRPDAVVFFSRQHAILAIDSKFPLSHYSILFGDKELSDQEKEEEKASFKNDVKARINEVADKYIIPGITTNQALMFIPNDGVFAYVHEEFKDLVEMALRKNVVIVSPSVLQPILVTFHAAQIDAKRAEDLGKINKELHALGEDFSRFSDRWGRIQGNVDTLKKNTDLFNISVEKINRKFGSVGSIENGNETKETGFEEISPLSDSEDDDKKQ